VLRIAQDYRAVDVEMRLRWWNANYVGTHFGGSLYAMVDPFFMLMIMENLGPDFVVWDKAASIRFRAPGKGTVRAEFRLSQEQLDSLRAQLSEQDKIEPKFGIDIKDEQGKVIAQVEKVVYIRRRNSKDSPKG
jgi:acyl-coenzyme A thioesterase PaaI-like protein